MKDKQSKQYLYIISISIDKVCINTEDGKQRMKERVEDKKKNGK